MLMRIFKSIFQVKLFPRICVATYSDGKMTVVFSDGSKQIYKGDSTVWRYYPSMKRCSISVESKLCDIQTYIKEHGNPYPDSHFNQPGNKTL